MSNPDTARRLVGGCNLNGKRQAAPDDLAGLGMTPRRSDWSRPEPQACSAALPNPVLVATYRSSTDEPWSPWTINPAILEHPPAPDISLYAELHGRENIGVWDNAHGARTDLRYLNSNAGGIEG